MIEVRVTGLDALRQELRDFSERRFKAAVATALTRTALEIKEAERLEMIDSFDRPTPYTLRSLYAKGATAQTLEAEVGIKADASGGRPPTKWLRPQVFGGLRRWTGFERALIRGGVMPDDMRAVPGRFARLDAFGNMSRGQMAQIISQMRIETGRAGSTRTMPRLAFEDNKADRLRKLKAIRRAERSAGGWFVALPNGRGRLRPGIYLMRDTAWGRAAPKPIVVFVSKAAYQPRFDFFYTAELHAKKMQGHLDRAINESAARMAAK